ncbi:MAG: 7TM domain-containing protein [Candidatus Magasanikbacteria bacterium]
MFKKSFLFCVIALFSFTPFLVRAEVDNNTSNTNNFSAIIFSDNYVQVGKKIIFDSSKSILPNNITNLVSYWKFGDQSYEYGMEVVHDFSKVGTYNVELGLSYTDENGQKQTLSSTKEIFVYDTRALMIVDEKNQDEINLIVDQAKEQGVALQVLSPNAEEETFNSEDSLVKLIGENSQYVKNSDIILFYTKSLRGLQSFTQYFQSLNDSDKELIRNKFFTVITSGNISVVTHGVYQNYKIINPKYILLTRPEALVPILSIKKIEDVETSLFGRSIEFVHVDNSSSKNSWYVLSTLVNYFIERGVPADSVYLILIIPFLSFLIIFFRNVVGINTFGVFTPIIVTIAFYILGLSLGLLTFFLAVIVSQLVKYTFDKVELLNLSKVGLNLSFISISFLFLIAVVLKFNLALSLTGAIFPMLVMTTLSEKFMDAKLETGFKMALFGVLETLFVVLLSYYLMVWSAFNNLLISWPEIVLFPIFFMFLLGKFTGLRVSEYIRFRSLFLNHTGEEE